MTPAHFALPLAYEWVREHLPHLDPEPAAAAVTSLVRLLAEAVQTYPRAAHEDHPCPTRSSPSSARARCSPPRSSS